MLVFAVALVPRALGLMTAVAPARDAFRFFGAAQTCERLGLLDAVKAIDVHPLYPASLLVIRKSLAAVGLDGPFAWTYAAQLWSVACVLAFLAFAYCAGVGLWGARVAGLGCAALAIVPRQVGYGIDVLSDNLHAAVWMASFAAAVWWWRTERPSYAILAGTAAGLAYLTRIEAIVLPLSFVAAWSLAQLVPRWRMPWRRALVGAALYVAGFGVLGGSYAASIGALSPRQSARAIVGGPTRPEPRVTLAAPMTRLADRDVTEFLPAEHPLKQPKEPTAATVELTPRPYTGQEGYVRRSLVGALLLLLFEIGEETRVWIAVLALVAVVDRRRSLTAMPAGLLAFFAVAACGCMLVVLPIMAGYLTGRYMMPILPLVSMFAITGAEAIVHRVCRMGRRAGERRLDFSTVVRRRTVGTVAAIGAVGLIVCVPGWFRPLHGNRFGHMQAAAWLAANSAPHDLVFDPNFFSAFFANRSVWMPGAEVPESLPVRFAVVDATMIYRTDNVTHQTIAKINAEGRLAARFPKSEGGQATGVYLFEIVGNRQARIPPRGEQR